VTDTPDTGEREPVAQGAAAQPGAPSDVAELIALIDRIEPMLAASGLDEVEVGVGDTTLVLRTPVAQVPAVPLAVRPAQPPVGHQPGPAGHGEVPPPVGDPGLRQVKAPLTGVFYLSPSPGAAPYVKVGGEVIAGQVIGLLEAMKLFNEIKSDVTGVVRRIVAEHGALVKTHQVLIEVEPT
jgi:acetyl-CoA carboxylase biotin carboxyl carrier protein